ncbi:MULTISPECIES: hypothetical protein [Paenibacillus]|uniref:hypothetical protein n=1 Tax=Paenibacillus TaxID=44249 RepID=UPI001BCF5EDF|nr:hypothetical protein [Paenibacillus dendritiformis]
MFETRGEKNLNSLFSKSDTLVQSKVVKPQPIRKERSDKLKDIKFPVTPDQREKLRRMAKIFSSKGARNVTESSTLQLKQALDHYRLYPERCHEVIYQDTGQYMHVKPTRRMYDEIEELSYKWNLSIRKTTHRLLMNFLDCGEVVIRYEQV